MNLTQIQMVTTTMKQYEILSIDESIDAVILGLRSGKEIMIYPDGHQVWFKCDERHRENGPAEIWPNGTKRWFLNGWMHRKNGPAEIYADGSKSWWLYGNEMTEAEHARQTTTNKRRS